MLDLGDLPTPAVPASSAGQGATVTRSGALVSVAGATVGTTQWKVEEIQLVNWGGFTLPEPIPFDPRSTLLSGASGAGKSTLLDAYTAVMMPTDTPFNGASNEAGGRARGLEQRSVVSYVRGQTDVTTDDEGVERAHVLRGDRTDTWGGAAVVFVSDRGDRFTAARVYYVPATAVLGSQVTTRMLTVERRLNLRDLEPLAAKMFAPRELRTLLPGLTVHDSHGSYDARLHTRLGIGANDDGNKALRLLARVQGGITFRTVDNLYKETVLEQPATFAKADKALEHFDHLAETYRTMQDEYRKERILRDIPTRWDALTAAKVNRELLVELHDATTGNSPLTVWETRREVAMLEVAEATAFGLYKIAQEKHAAAERAMEQADLRVEEARTRYLNAGGGALATLDNDIERAGQDIAARTAALRSLRTNVEVLFDGSDIDLTDRAQFDRLRAAADAAGSTRTSSQQDLLDEIGANGFTIKRLSDDLAAAKTNLRRLKASGTRLPDSLEQMRAAVCARAGLDVSQAPFLAELVDVKADQGRWRTAVEKVLGAAATRMLVPAEQLDAFTRAVNDLKISGELRYDGADRDLPNAPPADPQTTAGKLDFARSPYRGWAMRRVTEPGLNALCVQTPDELGGGGFRVSLTGQTRKGRAGSLGRSRTTNVLGFSNEDLQVETQDRIHRLEADLEAAKADKDRLDARFTTFTDRASAYRTLAACTFEAIDVREAQAREKSARDAREQIRAGNSGLADLEETLRTQQVKARRYAKASGTAETAASTAKAAHLKYAQDKDAASDRLDAMDAGPSADVLTEAGSTYLDEAYATLCAGADPGDHAAFASRTKALRRQLATARDGADRTVDSLTSDLESTFEQYLLAFPSPNLTPRMSAYPDFARMLEEIRSVGLHQRRQTWRQTLMDWSGQHLFLLHQAMSAALSDIEDRMIPINAILAGLPFGPTDSRLKIRPRRLQRDHVTVFRKQLKDLSSGATLELADDQMEARFKELEAFMAQLRSPKDPAYNPKLSQRDELLDVRRHVEVLAERLNPQGVVEATYTSLGSKSGGETQELIAFIVGAALRYRLGDEDRERPRFAPVFLDEAFIKADAQFASRAVSAWTGLGFQLIVGAPMDKFAALEPHMNAFLVITKNQTTKRSHIKVVDDAQRSRLRERLAAKTPSTLAPTVG